MPDLKGEGPGAGEEKALAANDSVWARRFSIATQVLLGLYLAILMVPKWRHVGNCFALLALICAVALAIFRPFPRATARVRWMFIGGLIGFLGMNLLAVVLAEDIPGMGRLRYEYVHLPGVVLALAVGLGVRDEKSGWRLLAILLITSGLWYLGEVVSLPWRSPYLDGRFVGARGYHTIVAMELLMLCSLYLASAATLRHIKWALPALAGALLAGVLIFMTKTRLAMLVVMLATVPCVAVVQRRLRGRRLKLAAVCVWLLLVAPAAGLVWWHSASPERRSPENVYSRMGAWKISLQIVARAPWYRTMIGHGRFRYTFPAAAEHYEIDSPFFRRERFRHAHNVLLQSLVETGIPGAAALLLVFGAAFYRAVAAWLRERKVEAGVSGVMVVALVTMAAMSQMDYCLWKVLEGLCWFVTGLAFASGAHCGTPSREEAEPGA